MKNKKILLGTFLIIIGFFGILSILTMPLPTETETVLKNNFTTFEIKLLTLINPTILLIIFVIIGTVLYQKVNLKAPIIEKLFGIRKEKVNISRVLKYGIFGGILSGILISLVSLFFNPILPIEFLKLGESLKPTLWARFLYGGITEEILMRFGFMTLIVWLCSKIFKVIKPFVFWTGIFISSIIFGLGHLPIAYQVVNNPTTVLLTYIIIGNSIGGIIFGWLYWKKGLESAFIAHIFTHIVMLLSEQLLN